MTTTTGGVGNPSLPPIGLLLRKLDRLIDERFERTLGIRGITRRQWQLLHTLAENRDPRVEETAEQHLEALAENGLIRADDDVYTLTEPGHALYESLMIEVQTIRDLTVAGLADGEYERTVTTLQVMISNLEAGA